MRITAELAELTEPQWAYVHRVVRTSYEFTEGQTRACVTFVRDGEQRHAEMPLNTFSGVLVGLAVAGVADAVKVAMESLTAETTQRFPNPPRDGRGFIAPGDRARPL